MKKYYVGVDLGGTNVRSSVVTEDGKILGGGKVPSKAMEGLDATVEQLLLSVKLALESAKVDISEVIGVGMSVPGTHKSAEGIVVWSPNFNGWNGVNLAKPIRDALGVPVCMGNDANVAAFGEYAYGAGKGTNIMVMLTLGTGIGSGVIIDGKIFKGVNEVGPELGHTIIQTDGPRCSCGRYGCVEALARRDAIIDRAARKAHLGRPTILVDMCDNDLRDLTPAIISEAASKGDEVAVETVKETGYYVGIAVSNAINIFNPDKVVIGGGIAAAGDLLFDSIKTTARVNALYAAYSVCEIVPAELGDDAGTLGGAALARAEA